MIGRRALHALIALVGMVVLAAILPLGAAGVPWPAGVGHVAVSTTRVGATNVYSTAVLAARREYPGWRGVRHVVIVSSSRDFVSDAAAASSMCWAYDAPILYTRADFVPPATLDALRGIVSANTTVTVHVVGSSAAVSSGCVSRMRSAVGSNTVEQPWPRAGRYSLAACVAGRVRAVAAARGLVVPAFSLLARGGTSTGVLEAGAAAAVSRHTGIPLLYASSGELPASTRTALTAAGHPSVIAVGGRGSISSAVYDDVHASERWGGPTALGTAVVVASRAHARGWSAVATLGVAATARDAAVAANLAGRDGGVVVLSDGVRLDRDTSALLVSHGAGLRRAWAVGSTNALAPSQLSELSGGPAVPWLRSGHPYRWVAKRATIAGHVGGNTTSVTLYVHGERVGSAAVRPWESFSFSSVAMPSGSTRVSAVAGNPTTRTATAAKIVKRLRYSASTCIIVDKSAFRLFWIRHNVLSQIYPVAIGRASLETPAPVTWKILQKYHTDPGGVYGPRKMRLYRRQGGRWVRTRYGIHGTNEPWVIGTKASHGCIRLYNHDILDLYPRVPLGTVVYTRQ